MGFVAFDDHGLDDVPNCRLQHDPDDPDVTRCDGYSLYPDLDTAAPLEVDVHDIVLEVTV